MKRYFFITLILFLIFFTSCKKERKWDADTSKVSVNLKINRYETDLFTTPLDSFYKKLPQWQTKYDGFLDIYFYNVIGVGLPVQKEFLRNLRQFREYCNVINLYDEVMKVFPPEDEFIRKSLTEAFKRYKFYFPDRKVPAVYTCISGFQVSVFTSDNMIGISLDKYLGADYDIYTQMFEQYLRRRMFKEMLPVDVMRAWAIAEFPYKDSVKNLMSKMIYEGRVQYFLDVMFPDVSDTLKWGYTYPQWGWANTYEKKIWDYLVDKKLLFSDNSMDIKVFTGESPFTTVFHNNSAPRAGTFIGYKIVCSYMNNHPETGIYELMKMTDYMKIYNEAYYNP